MGGGIQKRLKDAVTKLENEFIATKKANIEGHLRELGDISGERLRDGHKPSLSSSDEREKVDGEG